MNTDISLLTRSREENWLPILELAVEEVFEIMLGCRVRPGQKPTAPSAVGVPPWSGWQAPSAGF